MRRITHLSIALLSVSVVLFCGCTRKNSVSPARQGVMDLTQWNFGTDGIVQLDGEWEFYWQKLLEPADFEGKAPPGMTGFFNIPGYWNGHEVNGKSLKGDGYATFRLKVMIHPDQDGLAV